MKAKEIIITQDTTCEMLKIETSDGKCIFSGNEWDFNRDGDSFKNLFEQIGLKVTIINKKYEEW